MGSTSEALCSWTMVSVGMGRKSGDRTAHTGNFINTNNMDYGKIKPSTGVGS